MDLRQSTAVTIRIGPFVDKTDGVTLKTAISSGSLNTDLTLSKAFGAAAVRNGTPGATSYDAAGCYFVPLNTTDTNTLGNLRVDVVDATTFLPVWELYTVITAVEFDAKYGTGYYQVDVLKWNSTTVATPATAGIPDINAKNINNVSASSVTTVNANIGTTQPTNYTGTGTSALVKGDTVDWAGGAIPAPNVTGVPKIDLTYILGTLLTETAGQLAGGFKKFFNISSPTATMDHGVLTDTTTTTTTTANLTNAPTNGDFTATMKTSLNASTPASVTTVTGNVNGNVAGSVGSVLGNVAGSVASVVGNIGGNVVGSIGSLATQAKTDVAAAVLNAVAASYNVAGSIGALINQITSSSGSAAAVWNYLVSAVGTNTTMMGAFIVSLLNGINSRTLSPPVNINSSDTNVLLNITQTVTYSAANNNRKQVNVAVSVDPTGCTVTWTFLNGSNSRDYDGVLVSYDSGTGIAVVAMADFEATKAEFPAPSALQLAKQSFSVTLALPASAGNLVPIGYHFGQVLIQAAG